MTGRVWAGEGPAGTRFICVYDRLPPLWSWIWEAIKHPRLRKSLYIPVSKAEADSIAEAFL